MPKTLIEFKDFEIKLIFDEINSDLQLSRPRKQHKDFCKHYVTRTTSDVSWLQVCTEVKSLKCLKFALMFICKLLNKNLYIGDNSTYLYKLLPFINIIVKESSSNFDFIMCGDRVKDLIIYENIGKSNRFSYLFLTSRNIFIKSLVSNFLSTLRKHFGWNNANVIEVFEVSLGTYIDQINSYKDFNDHTFWQQINFYKNYYKEDKVQLDYSITCTCAYYRWLVNTYSEYNFFESSFTMTEHLLFSSRLTELIRTDYYFTSFNPNNHPGYKNRICFILRGFENLSTRITNEDYFIVDASEINNSFYSKTFISYILSFQNVSIFSNQKNFICTALKFILEMKSQKNYPNKPLDYMTNQEAVLIRNFAYDKRLELSTLNNRIGTIRRFLLWCQDSNIIKFDDMFFSYLSQYEEPSSATGVSIPDDKLLLLNNYISNDAKQSHIAKLSYVIFHLLIQTEFRISQICHLTVNCIKPTVKPNQFFIHTNSKTSNGLKSEFVITDLTYHLLMNIIEDTEVFRDKCNIDSYKNYIFLYDGRYSSISLMDSNKFYSYMRSVCKALNFEETYSASNLRSTHMTKAFEHTIRNGKSDIDLSVLSKHKHIDITKNHYIEMQLEQMLESTYGVTIGNINLIDTDSKIIDTIPLSLDTPSTDVENGCGKCTVENCVITSSLPCMACNHFITTVAHEIFFIKAIENIDRLIQKTTNEHDKQDFVIIKQLYVLYLKAIYKHKEEL